VQFGGTAHITALKPLIGTSIRRILERSAHMRGRMDRSKNICGIIQNIIKLDYRIFDMFFFDVRWFKDILDKVPQGSIIVEGNGFTMIDSINLCIKLSSGDMIDINKDTNIFLTIDIDQFLVIDSHANHNSCYILFSEIIDFIIKWRIFLLGF
jgi:hypothetical protein